MAFKSAGAPPPPVGETVYFTSGFALPWVTHFASTTGYIAYSLGGGATVIIGDGVSYHTFSVNDASYIGDVSVWSCAGPADSTHSGKITYVSIDPSLGPHITAIDLSETSALTELVVSSGAITTLNLEGNQHLRVLEAVGCTSLVSVYLKNNVFSGTPRFVSNIWFDTCTSLAVVRAPGVSFVTDGGGVPTEFRLEYAPITGFDLDVFFTDLAAGDGVLNVFYNTGSPTCTPSIATAKGYTVYT